MASYGDREAFIPYSRKDIIELCLEDGQLSASDADKFREFCTILAAYYHFKFHSYLERLKDNYALFNPDADTKTITEVSSRDLTDREAKLVADFQHILERANYVLIPQNSLERALEEESLIKLKTKVNLDEFDRLICYCRGDIYEKIKLKNFYFWEKEVTINLFSRVVLLLKFKNQAYFERKKTKSKDLNFTPGKMYLYFYKNIPKYDLELLFPNIKISMTLKDRLLFGIPAIGAAIPVILKTLPQLTLIIAAIFFFTVGTVNVLDLNVREEEIRDFMPVLVATLSLAIALGGFAFKQYSNYKSKLIKFRKDVTDTLFFKNLANNESVFQALIDAAEEEECKEIILVYYHLLTSSVPLTPDELDDCIETWMLEKFDTKIDFDINGPIGNLEEICGQVNGNSDEVCLLRKDRDGVCRVLPLDEAKSLIDSIWDRIFLYT
ncbi:TMEM143 family protein [Oscillatoria salina]|uniref:TMEM143 family protein n=1 Tax=Oscillatoria salina TaxID=331517 RepID=UPI0013BE4ECF|nr:TMEM143 family protein [Oscillatoria salina]MBZ8179165.1 DUF3754 domain-containing protein [Oscillatoria salina IIICB1]NET88050.1 DUF3754 domain-containing protein [Kamptonema sp. SIO1D9]